MLFTLASNFVSVELVIIVHCNRKRVYSWHSRIHKVDKTQKLGKKISSGQFRDRSLESEYERHFLIPLSKCFSAAYSPNLGNIRNWMGYIDSRLGNY